MDRDRGGDDRRGLLPRVGGRNLLGAGKDDPAPSDKFDMAEWDTPADPPSPAQQARGEADAAQAHSFFSHLAGDVQRILAGIAGIAGFRELGADIRARLADSAAKDAKRAEEEAARDKAIAARLIDPDTLARHGEAGARQGAREALASTVTEMRRQLAADADARELLSRQIANDHADRRAHEVRTRQHDRLWYGALAGFALLIPVALGYGYHFGDDAGDASGYARSRDEVAAASWANTPNGKLARQIDQASQLTLPAIANCPDENGWHSVKQNGRRVCYGTSSTAKMITGWTLP